MDVITTTISIIKKLADFFEFLQKQVERKDYLMYRGMHSSKFELIPSIGRIKTFKKKKLTIADEITMLEDFKSMAHPFIKDYNYSTLELLAFGQHHGLATRLLDWTKNPLVAAYFAVEEPFDGDEEYSCIYVHKSKSRPKRCETFDPFTITDVRVYVPIHLDARITRQEGFFTVHSDPNVAWESPDVEKFLIHKDIREDIKLKLNNLGINAGTIYPEIDGISKYVTWALSDLY